MSSVVVRATHDHGLIALSFQPPATKPGKLGRFRGYVIPVPVEALTFHSQRGLADCPFYVRKLLFGVPLLNEQRAPSIGRLLMLSTMLSRELSSWENSQPNMLS